MARATAARRRWRRTEPKLKRSSRARSTATSTSGGATARPSSGRSPVVSCSTAPPSDPPPARSSSTTCSCSPVACSPPNPTCARRLHDRYRRLLLDEFQDTDPIQLEIAVRLTAPPAGQAVDGVAGLRPVPGRLFVVGDPKQSIYRFRRADIAMYLAAAGQVGAEREVLSANFRSTDAVIDWVNGVFGTVIQPEPGVQPAYGALDACRPAPRDHGTVHVLGSRHATTTSPPRSCAEREADVGRRRRRHRTPRRLAGRRRRGRSAAVPSRRHRRAAAGTHVTADARSDARRG